ncbi:bidirectional sugar transporter SWEET4-like [Corylus avellana]|uniref:bidirectional sugar transporter SWEET4-like n=1 Tax=Corylus avellana TaxID=13451 RepID=UPI00286CF4D8|nr:bidirectional sugar transporter SWEET4-like [Corylus avellana]
MVSTEAARMTVGVLGNIVALFLFLSPVPTFVQIWKKGSVEHYSPAPYLATLVNCMVWTFYSLPMVHPHSTLVLTIDGAGIAIELTYLIIFFIFSDRKKRLKFLLGLLIELIFISVLTSLVLTLTHSHKERSLIVGIIGILFGIMMYASPLVVMKMVLTTRSVEYMPFFLSFTGFLSGLTWSTYALIQFDLFILVPSVVGVVFSMAQLILYATFYKSTKRQIAEREGKTGQMDLLELVVNEEESKKVGSGAP